MLELDATESRLCCLRLCLDELHAKGVDVGEFNAELEQIRFWCEARASNTAAWERGSLERLAGLMLGHELENGPQWRGAVEHLRGGRLWLAARRLESEGQQMKGRGENGLRGPVDDVACVLEQLEALVAGNRLSSFAAATLKEELEHLRRLLGRKRRRLAEFLLWDLATRKWEEI